jgi:hypothetical protein
MDAAPEVAVRVTGGWAWRLCASVLPGLAAGVFSAWLLLTFEGQPQHALALSAVASGAAGALAWRRGAVVPVTLRWDGRQWSAGDAVGTVAVCLDLGPFMLLVLRPVALGAARWLPVCASDAGPAWHVLRVAAHARQTLNSDPDSRSRRVAQ